MSRKPDSRDRRRQLGPSAISQAMLQRVQQRAAVAGSVKIPAVPGLLDKYAEICSAIFSASGRTFTPGEAAAAKELISNQLHAAFVGSPRSKITINYQADAGHPLGYSVNAEVSTIADAYERWVGTSDAPLFGTHPDARVVSLASDLDDPASSPILDLGAGTGRNALALAASGFPIDAVELTPKFAEILRDEAARRQLPIRVIAEDIFKAKQTLRRDYRLFFASEVVPDFRSPADLRQLFELAAEVLVDGGMLLFNVHLAVQGFTPEKAAREFAQQCYSALFTPSEVKEACTGLPFEFVSNDSVYEYELAHLPEPAWPPTPWFINWVSGLDVYDLDRDQCPVELRWLTFRRTGSASEASASRASDHAAGLARPTGTGRPRKFDPAQLRQALIRRLTRRAVATGSMTLPAVPALLDRYVSDCFSVFTAIGRKVTPEQVAHGKTLFERALEQAFVASPRSNIVVTYEVMMGTEVRYTVTPDAVPISQVYQDWLEALPEPIFGDSPDARLVSMVDEMGDQTPRTALDIGAGTGRNTQFLVARGYAVDAVELTPKFADMLRARASTHGQPIRVIEGDFFEHVTELGRGYSLVLLSGVLGDFRGIEQLRAALEIAAERLMTEGVLALNIHVAKPGYEPDLPARQWGQQCCATLFTASEIAQTLVGLPLEIVKDDSAFDFERAHLPEAAWPPTPAYEEWALGQHMYALEREQCPIELRWLVLRKSIAT